MQEQDFRAKVVWLIIDGKTEQALAELASCYRVETPILKVGLPKGRKKNASGTYNTRNRTICILNSDVLRNPFVVLHEFYHHMRTGVDGRHRGIEKYADEFALQFIQSYNAVRSIRSP